MHGDRQRFLNRSRVADVRLARPHTSLTFSSPGWDTDPDRFALAVFAVSIHCDNPARAG